MGCSNWSPIADSNRGLLITKQVLCLSANRAKLVGRVGIEPTKAGLRVRYLSQSVYVPIFNLNSCLNLLSQSHIKKWWYRQGSNLNFLPYEGSAIPNSATVPLVVHSGIEPDSSRLSGECLSFQLVHSQLG